MKKIIALFVFLAITVNIVFSQQTVRQLPPRLIQGPESATYDEQFTADGEIFYFRSGKNIILPTIRGTALKLGLDSSLATDGMTGVEMSRNLPLRSPILSPYGQLYSDRDKLIVTRITGHKAGTLKKAVLVVEPKILQITVENYIQIGEKNGRRIFLKPGKWRLEITSTIRAIENAEGKSWYAKSAEKNEVVGPNFGFNKKQSYDDRFDGLLYLNPYGAIAYGFTKVGSLLGFLFKRPNIRLPASSELHFNIEQIEATYISDLIPVTPATKAKPVY
jgi:hypothetical protein